MKFYGLILLFSAFSLVGFLKANSYLSSLKDIKRAEFLIKNIGMCIKKENMSVGKIFEICSLECDEKTKIFLDSISPKDFGNVIFFSQKSNFCKDKTANRILQEAFLVLGKYSAAEQLSELEFCRKKANELYSKSENDLLSKAKIFKYSGILAGIFLVIILI